MQKLNQYVFALFFIFSIPFNAQENFLQIIEGTDTSLYQLIYPKGDTIKDNKLIAYHQENEHQIAFEKNYFLGKQSGVTKTYFLDGKIYEIAIYQRGKKEGDYSRFNSLGELVIKAQYNKGKKSGYYINRVENIRGRYKNDKRKGKWEFQVGTPDYYREFYSDGK